MGTNEELKDKQAIKKIPLLFLEFATNNPGYNRQVQKFETQKQSVAHVFLGKFAID